MGWSGLVVILSSLNWHGCHITDAQGSPAEWSGAAVRERTLKKQRIADAQPIKNDNQ